MNRPTASRARVTALAVLLVSAGVAGPVRATCPTLYFDSPNVAYPLNSTPNRDIVDQELPYWAVFGLVTQNNSDWDMELYTSDIGSEPSCLSGYLAGSAWNAGYADFVVGDFNHNPLGYYYIGTHCVLGDCSAGLKGIRSWRNGGYILGVDSPAIVQEISPTDFQDQVAAVYDVYLNQNQQYWIRFSHVGDHNPHLFLFRNPAGGTYWTGRSGAVLTLSGCGTYTAPSTGWYGVVIANDNWSSSPNGSFTVGVFTTPNCGCPQVLADGVPVQTPASAESPAFYDIPDYQGLWKAIAVRGASDWDLDVGPWTTAGPNAFCMSSVAAHSAFSTLTDMVVTVDTTYANDTLAVRVNRYSGSGDATVERKSTSGVLRYNDPVQIRNLGPSDLVDGMPLSYYSGYPYEFEVSTYTSDLHLYRYGPPTQAPQYKLRMQGPEVVDGTSFFNTVEGYGALFAVKDHLNSDAYSIRWGGCWEAFDWPDSQVYGLSRGLSWAHLPAAGSHWTAITAVCPTADWDMEEYVHSTGGPWPVCLDSLGATSDGVGLADMLVGDRRYMPSDSAFVRLKQFSTGTQVSPRLQWRPSGIPLIVNAPPISTTTASLSNILELFECDLAGGTTYTISFVPSAGSNLHCLVFGNPGKGTYWAPRSGRLLDLTASSSFTPNKSDTYAIIVVNESLQSASYSIAVTGGVVAVGDPEAAPDRTRITNVSPNPGSGPVTIAYAAAGSAPVTFDVLDAAGRRVALLEHAAGGKGVVAWSGRDQTGRAIPGGLYFLRLAQGGRTIETRKLVRLR